MTPNGQIAIPLDKAAIREPFWEHDLSPESDHSFDDILSNAGFMRAKMIKRR